MKKKLVLALLVWTLVWTGTSVLVVCYAYKQGMKAGAR